MKSVRCAIYTRKSSDEGLEQDFNSLDAQREACTAYVLSQASEGWKLIPEHYDDGGLSGGTLERPALQRLLGDVRAGRIDIIVVYKVDRLTRSLLDFAKLVEAFDDAGTSFVSVTQSFNTTTSMGRLTLNMLLSFAQFEREVTAERIRDKIAASKAKGMWMGGTPPLGYKPEGRSLAVIEEQAELVRDIYRRYRKLGNVRLVAEELNKEGITTPIRTNGKGRSYGGRIFTRGHLYTILRNPIYAGDIAHKGTIYPGNHPAIIDRDTWDAVQQQLADNVKGTRQTRESNASLLAGLLFDPTGEPLIAVHTNKPAPGKAEGGRRRYRYYVSKAQQHGTASAASPALRLPASEIEQVVRQELAARLADPLALLQRCRIDIAPAMLRSITERSSELCAALKRSGPIQIKKLITRIVIHSDRLELVLSPAGLADLFGIRATPAMPATINHDTHVRLTRTGHRFRLIQNDGNAAAPGPDKTLVQLLLKARRWWNDLSSGEIDIAKLSRRENVTPSYMARVVRLTFLAPDVVEAILAGNIRAEIDGKALLATGTIAARWEEQAATFLPARTS